MTENNGNVEKETLESALKKEFGSESVKNLADDLSTVEIDGKQYSINGKTAGGGNQDGDGDKSNLKPEELAALAKNGIAEITGNEITNENLKNNSRIKGVITGNVPITTEMTYIEGTLDTGVVVAIGKTETNTGNEFVWVPVPAAITSSVPSTTGVDLQANPNTERPMAILQSGSDTNYQGVLYDINGTTSTAKSIESVTGDSSCREPAYLSGSNYDDNTTYGKLFSASDLQSEYNKMVTSVNEYGGFYVARYELGLDSIKNPVSKNATEGSGITTADASNSDTSKWYGLYSKINSMYQESGNQNIVSQMIWGSQYDAMMNWMAKTGKTVGTADDEKYNQQITTGSKAEDKINNVYDLYGCHAEWTQEAFYTVSRVSRGGHLGLSYPPALRGTYYPFSNSPSYTNVIFSSRPTLYIRE